MLLIRKLALAAAARRPIVAVIRATVRWQRNFDWRPKRIVITGGSRVLGLVPSRQLADQGVRSAITARNEDDLNVAAAELCHRGAEVVAHPCNVRDRGHVTLLIKRVKNRFDGVDVPLNVAEIVTVGPLEGMMMGAFHDSLQTNSWGAFASVLPERGSIGRRSAEGHQREPAWWRSILTMLTQRVAAANNQI